MSENTRNTDLVPQRVSKGDRLTADTVNKIIDSLNTLHRRQGNKSSDAGLWVRCVSDDAADPFSILEVYDAAFSDDEPTLMVRTVTSDAVMYCGNENYELFADGPGWVKVVRPNPDFVQVRATGLSLVQFDDSLTVQGQNVAPGGGVLIATTAERDFDRMVMVSTSLTSSSGELVGIEVESVSDDGVATCRVTFRPCGIARVEEEYAERIEVYDDVHQCLFNETEAALIGRRGTAAYMKPTDEEASLLGEIYPVCRWQVMSLCCP